MVSDIYCRDDIYVKQYYRARCNVLPETVIDADWGQTSRRKLIAVGNYQLAAGKFLKKERRSIR